MKIFRNLLIATTAAVVLTSASAFADELALTEYNSTDNTISVDVTKSSVLTDDTVLGDQVTVVIVPASAETLDEANIYYINQDAFGNKEAILVNMGIKGKELAKGDYLVKLGGSNGVIKTAKFTVGSQGELIQLGDVTLDGAVDVGDINPIIQHILGAEVLTGKQFKAADTTKDNAIDVGDINPVIQHILGATILEKITYTE